jgi:hypothetical protein
MSFGAGCWLDEDQPLERWQHRAQRAQQRQVHEVGRGEALVDPADVLRLAQLLAAPHPQLAAQRCGSLVISPQLLLLRLRRRPQLVAFALRAKPCKFSSSLTKTR